jgi:hypothetical protein
LEGDTFFFQVLHNVHEDHFGLAEFEEGGDKGEHDADVAANGGPKDGSELPLEHGSAAEAEPDAAEPKHWVGGFGEVVFEELRDFVGAQIERADHDRQITAGIKDAAVGFVVIGFGGFAIAAEEEEFGTVESDPVSTAADAVADFFGKFDVSTDGDAVSVDSFGRESFDLSEPFADALAAGLGIADAGERFCIGVDEDLSVVAVEDGVFAT